MALMLPLLLLIVFGITEFGRAWMAVNVMHTATREGVRLAVVSGAADSSGIKGRVKQVMHAANLDAEDGDITITWPPDSDTERKVTVSLVHDFTVLSGKVLNTFQGTVQLSAQTTMRQEF